MTQAITYTLFLEEPCLLTAPGGDPNTESSLSYIPGGALRGALAARYLRNGNDSADPTFTDLFLNGKVRYLNAYPCWAEKPDARRRALPARRAWARRKDVSQGQKDELRCQKLQPPLKEGEQPPEPDTIVYDRTVEDQRHCVESGIPKGLSQSFVVVDGAVVRSVKVEYEIAVHTARNRAKGRAIEGDSDSALFRYRALARGQTFGGVILLDDEVTATAAEKLTKLLGDRLLLGGSHTAGYGLIQVGNVQSREAWREMAGALDKVGDGKSFIVMLTSDAILRDPVTGGPTGDICAFLPGDYEVKESFAATGWVGGFNKQWGLPLAQEWAVLMGSTWLITAKNGIDHKGLAEVEERGIGARTAEGFGRLVVAPSWPLTTGFVMEKADAMADAPAPAGATAQDSAAQALLTRMNERAVRAELDRLLVKAVNEKANKKVRGHLSRSQLGRLQVRIRRATEKDKDGLKGFVGYLDGTRERKSADDQFRKFTLDNGNFRNTLHELANNPQTIWDTIGVDEQRLPPPIGPNPFNYRTDELSQVYTVRYIANLCRQLAKQEGES